MTEYAEIRRIIDDITVSFTPIRSSVGKITYTLLNLSIYKVGRPFNPHKPTGHAVKIMPRASSNLRIQTLADELHG